MALEVLSIVITPVNELGKYLVRKFKNELHYVTEYNSYFSNFHKELLQLQARRDDVQGDVEKARRESKEPRKQVLNWVEMVENLEKECRPLTLNGSRGNKCLRVLDCSRRRTSKQLLKLTKDICSLQEKGRFTDIADLPPSLAVVPMGPRGTVENIPSRELIKNEVMKALKDDNIRSIGVHGMGGIGKSTLVNSINDELCGNRSFKKVIMVTVSKDPDMKNIQKMIAERLDLKFEKEDMPTRAYKLCERLGLEKPVLIILDDVWKPMELGEIGLGDSIEHMPCKLIVTTRNVDVCRRMDVKKVIKMDILPEGEAWALFEAKAGDVVVKTPSLEQTAREIVGRCKGSPLAIVALGSTLRTKEEEEDAVSWAAHALQVLREPNAVSLEGIMDEVVASLRLSYEQLKPIVKQCFLYCCLFPEDDNIRLTDLRNYGIGEGFLKMTTSLKQAENELLGHVNILKDSCLLLGGEDKRSVKMHDVVRDVAICIASNDEHGFLVNVGGGSKYLPESEKLHTYKRISYMKNNRDSVFPNALECPQLRSLLVRDSYLEEILSFEGVKSLLVLHMERGWRWYKSISVPESISQLRNLRTLYLDGCDLWDKTYLLGGMTKLEVLSMRWSKIGELPVDFGNLINLKFLDLTYASIDFVAPNVFSRFLKMEELLIADSIRGWDSTGDLIDDGDDGDDDDDRNRWCTEDGSRRYAELKEVLSLPRLSVLDIVIYRELLDGEVLNYHNLQHFRIFFDYTMEMDGDFDCDMNTLQIVDTDLGKHVIGNLFAVSNKNLDLCLRKCGGFKSVSDLYPAGSYNHLKSLELCSCDDVESVIVADRSPITAQDSFEKLKTLELSCMSKMERILHGTTSSTKFLGKLEQLDVFDCSKICTIFPSNLLFTERRLENLKVVNVSSCDEVQHIFNAEDNEFGATPVTIALLCGITDIHLSNLPKLKSIWKGIMPEGSFQGLTHLYVEKCDSWQHLLPSDVAGLLQNLEEIQIARCDAMETIIYPIGEEAEDTSLLPRCRCLSVHDCPKLKSIFSLCVARRIDKLERLSISHCHRLRQVLGNGDESRVKENRCLLPELKYLELVDLRSLIRFDQDYLPISCPLQEIKVFVCLNLKSFPLQTVSALKFIHAEDIWFRNLEDESEASILEPFIQVAGLWLDDSDSQLEGTTQFRRLLSQGDLDDMPIWDVRKSGVVPFLVEFLTREDHTQLQCEAACVLANIVSRSVHTELVIYYGALPIFVKLLCSQNELIREEAIWALGKIARPISNATSRGSQEQIKHLVEQGCIKPFCDLLQCSDSDVVVLCLDCLFNILKVGETGGLGVLKRYVEVIDDSGGFQNIEYLQGHDNSEIQQKAVDILKSFQLEKYRPDAGDATVASFQSRGSKSNGVEKETISSKQKQVDLNNPPLSPYARDSWSNASVEQYTFKVGPGTNNNRPLLRPKPTNKNVSKIGLVRKEKRVIVRKDYGLTPADDPFCMTSLGNAKLKVGPETNNNRPLLRPKPTNKNASKIDLVKKEKHIIVRKVYGMTGADYPSCMTSLGNAKIDLKYPPSSSIEIEKERSVDQIPNEDPYVRDTTSNSAVKLDLNSLPSSSTELGKEGHVSQMPEQDNHESDSTVWDSSQNVFMGGSTSIATTSAHDDVWNDQSKHEHEDST